MSENEVTSVSTEENAEKIPVATSNDEGVQNPPVQNENSSGNDVPTPSTDKSTDNDSLDFDDIVKMPSTKEERDGKSRKEWMRENAKPVSPVQAPAEELTEEEELEARIYNRIMEKHAEKFAAIDKIDERAKADDRRSMEDAFKATLENKGISVKDFNDNHKAEFSAKRDEYLQAGLSPEKAVLVALDVVTARYESIAKIKESENRADGRTRARISPQSTTTPGKTTYTADQLSKLSQVEYNNIMDSVEKGEIKIV